MESLKFTRDYATHLFQKAAAEFCVHVMATACRITLHANRCYHDSVNNTIHVSEDLASDGWYGQKHTM